MALSNSTNYTVTRNSMVEMALEELNVVAPGETVKPNHQKTANNVLNMMLKSWQSQGFGPWLNQTAYLMIEASKDYYALGSGTDGDNCGTYDTSVITTLGAAAASGASTITVTSATGMSDADKIVITLDDNTVHETTINGAPSGTTITLTASLPSAAASGKRVYTYTTRIDRPLEVRNVQYYTSANQHHPLHEISEDEYFNKAANITGTPGEYFYDAQLSYGRLYLYPNPTNPARYCRMRIKRPIMDLDQSTNNFDLPQHWFEAIKYNLAMRLSIPFNRRQLPPALPALATSTLHEAKVHDRKRVNITFNYE